MDELMFSTPPAWNSEQGKRLYASLAKILQPQGSPVDAAILSTARLLVYLPRKVSEAMICPVEKLPLYINNSHRLVRIIVMERLKEGM